MPQGRVAPDSIGDSSVAAPAQPPAVAHDLSDTRISRTKRLSSAELFSAAAGAATAMRRISLRRPSAESLNVIASNAVASTAKLVAGGRAATRKQRADEQREHEELMAHLNIRQTGRPLSTFDRASDELHRSSTEEDDESGALIKERLRMSRQRQWGQLARARSHSNVGLAGVNPASAAPRRLATRACCGGLERSIDSRFVWLLRHDSTMAIGWNLLIATCGAYLSVTAPFYAAFPAPPPPSGLLLASHSWERGLEHALELLFGVDVLLCFLTTFQTGRGQHVAAHKRIARSYLRGTFVLDVLACLPAALLLPSAFGSGGGARRYVSYASKFLKLPRASSAGELAMRQFPWLMSLRSLRVVKLFLLVLVFSHWLACLWWLLTLYEFEAGADPAHSWHARIQLSLTPAQADMGGIGRQWLAAWATVVYMLVGTTNEQVTVLETSFTAVVMLIGAAISGLMVSKLSVHLAQLGARKRFYDESTDQVRAQMRQMRLPPELQKRVMGYYNHLFYTHGVFDLRQRPLDNLNPSLASEISVFRHRKMVSAVPFFKSVSTAVLQEVLRRLVPEVYLPGDYIVHMGEPGRALYFITTGRCAVYFEQSRDKRSGRKEMSSEGEGNPKGVAEPPRRLKQVAMLKEGSYFGEMALLEQDRVASAHVVADCIVDLQALWQVDFFDVLRQHPSLELEINKEVGKAGYLEQNHAMDGRTRIIRKRVGFEHMIGDLPLFGFCSPRVLQAIKASTKPVSFEHGEAILRMGESASGLFIITEGTCQVQVPAVGELGTDAATAGRRPSVSSLETVRTLTSGDWFGELSLLNQQPVSAHVIAYGPCVMQMLSRASFDALKLAHPELVTQLKVAVEDMDYQNLSPFAMEVPFFKGCPAPLIKSCLRRLEHRSYDPGQYIVQRGAAGKGLMFVSMGECHVRVPHEKMLKEGKLLAAKPAPYKVARVLKEGSHFGELSLLEPAGLAKADVVVSSEGPCVLQVLPKAAYRAILEEHPVFEDHLRNVSERANYSTLSFLVTSVPLFTYCTPEVIEALVAKLRVETYPPSAYIIQRGRLGRALYVVRKGLCHALVDAGDELKVVGSIKEGGQFGELSLMFPERPTAAHVVAVDPVEVLVLLRTDFDALRASMPQLSEALQKRVKEMKYEEMHFFNTRCSAFSEALGKEALSELIGHITQVKHAKGTELVSPAAECKALTFLKAGECLAELATEGVATRLFAGAIYGETLLGGGGDDDDGSVAPPRRVVARTAVETYVLPPRQLLSLAAESPELLAKVREAVSAQRAAPPEPRPSVGPRTTSSSRLLAATRSPSSPPTGPVRRLSESRRSSRAGFEASSLLGRRSSETQSIDDASDVITSELAPAASVWRRSSACSVESALSGLVTEPPSERPLPPQLEPTGLQEDVVSEIFGALDAQEAALSTRFTVMHQQLETKLDAIMSQLATLSDRRGSIDATGSLEHRRGSLDPASAHLARRASQSHEDARLEDLRIGASGCRPASPNVSPISPPLHSPALLGGSVRQNPRGDRSESPLSQSSVRRSSCESTSGGCDGSVSPSFQRPLRPPKPPSGLRDSRVE